MVDDIHISGTTKEEKYASLLTSLKALMQGESDPIANMANTAAALKETFGFLWVGFYMVRDNELVLGPFQGPVACTRIIKGKGVCGTAWEKKQTLIVDDVEKFPGHIACSSLSRSEIVVPLVKQGKVVAVLDVDSEQLSYFDDTDRLYLEQIASLLTENRV